MNCWQLLNGLMRQQSWKTDFVNASMNFGSLGKTNNIHHLSHLFYGFLEFFDRDQIFCLIDVVDNLKGNVLESKWIAFKVSLVGKNKGIFELLMINQKKLWKIWWAKRKKGTLKSCCPFYQKKLQTITIWWTDTQKESCSCVTN